MCCHAHAAYDERCGSNGRVLASDEECQNSLGMPCKGVRGDLVALITQDLHDQQCLQAALRHRGLHSCDFKIIDWIEHSAEDGGVGEPLVHFLSVSAVQSANDETI